MVLLRLKERPAFTLAELRRGMVFITQIMMAVDNLRLEIELHRCQSTLN